MDAIDIHRRQTEEDILRKLKKFGKCAEVRPCDFGKTYGAVKVAIENYNNILYLYPQEQIMQSAVSQICEYYGYERYKGGKEYDKAMRTDKIEKFTFMTYMTLIRRTEEEMSKFNFDLIIADEVQCIGATKTNEAIELLRKTNPNAHFLGMTATPDRTDAFDVIERHFDNILVYPYTLHDAFVDGALKKPYYIYSTYHQEEQIKQEILDEWKKKSWKANSTDIQLLDKKVVELANLYNLPNIIKGVCKEAKVGNYLKFICFFDNFKHLAEKGKEIENWFKEAYPDYELNITVITSETQITHDNVKKLDSLITKPKHVDLIYSVNMMNLGYHVNNLTGIIMYRCTSSNIVYIQQLGRALFSHKRGIIIDVVNNIGRKALYDNYLRSEEISYKERLKKEEILNGTWEDTYVITTNEGEELSIPKEYYYDKDSGQILRKWTRNCNSLRPDDYIVTGVEASRKQLEKKVIAESFIQVAHKVLLNYFKLWCENVVNIPFPISMAQMEKAYGYTREDFKKWFEGVIKEEHISFPYHTLKTLTEGDKLFENICIRFAKTNRINPEEIYNYYN